MNTPAYDPTIDDFILQVVHRGSTYQIEKMETLYAADQSLLLLRPDGTVARISRAEMLAEFSARRRAGDVPLSEEHRVMHVEQQRNDAVALLFRRMSDKNPAALYELRLRKEEDGWKVSGETVIPWPDLALTGAFLPPRQHADRDGRADESH